MYIHIQLVIKGDACVSGQSLFARLDHWASHIRIEKANRTIGFHSR